MPLSSFKYQGIWDRKVGTESQRTYEDKIKNGFFDTYMKGEGLDIGYAGYVQGCNSILPNAVGIDLNFPGYDGKTLPFLDNSQDYVYSSHTLEHVIDYKMFIKEAYRVTKIGGYIVTIVPHQFLYEKKKDLPSRYNGSHYRFYTPASLLKEFEESLEPNSYRVRLLEDEDQGFTYDLPPETHSGGCYQILSVLQKIKKPDWDIL